MKRFVGFPVVPPHCLWKREMLRGATTPVYVVKFHKDTANPLVFFGPHLFHDMQQMPRFSRGRPPKNHQFPVEKNTGHFVPGDKKSEAVEKTSMKPGQKSSIWIEVVVVFHSLLRLATATTT